MTKALPNTDIQADLTPSLDIPKGVTTSGEAMADVEVQPTKKRKRYTAAYKMRVLGELDCCVAPGSKGAVIRREGLYSSQITDWRRQREEGILSALGQSRGRKKAITADTQRVQELEAKLLSVEKKLAQAEAIIDVQKKVS